MDIHRVFESLDRGYPNGTSPDPHPGKLERVESMREHPNGFGLQRI